MIKCGKVLYGEGAAEATEWRNAFCTTLCQRGPLEVVTELGLLAKSRRGRKRQAIQTLQGYMAKRLEVLDYPRFLAEGFQIGSGPTESQCKSLAARLKGRGRHWNRSGIDAHMAIDCLYHNPKQWTAYWPKTPTPKICTDTKLPMKQENHQRKPVDKGRSISGRGSETMARRGRMCGPHCTGPVMVSMSMLLIGWTTVTTSNLRPTLPEQSQAAHSCL